MDLTFKNNDHTLTNSDHPELWLALADILLGNVKKFASTDEFIAHLESLPERRES